MEVKKQNPIAMATLWIDNNLVIRHSEKGWPVEPQMSFGDYNPEEQKIYLDELAQAKAESVPFEDHNAVLKLVYANKDKNGISILTSMYADTFIEIAGEVIVGYQVKTYGGWADVSKDNYESTDEEYRKVARLKPAKEPIRADLTEQQMDDHIEALTAPFPTEEKVIQMSRCCQDMHKENEQLHAQLAASEKRCKELEEFYWIAEYALRDIDAFYWVIDPIKRARVALEKLSKLPIPVKYEEQTK